MRQPIIITDARSCNFWYLPDSWTQRISTKQWKYLLLNNLDTFIAGGRLRQLKAKSLGAGVYEIHAEIKNP